MPSVLFGCAAAAFVRLRQAMNTVCELFFGSFLPEKVSKFFVKLLTNTFLSCKIKLF